MKGIATPDMSCPRFKTDPFSFFKELREETPIRLVRISRGKSAWLISRHDQALAVLSDGRFVKDPANAGRKSGALPSWLPGPLRALSRNMLDLDEPDHRRLRNLVQKAFTPRVVEELRPRIEALVEDLLDRMERKGSADLIDDYAAPLPVTVISELLGIPERSRTRFRAWTERIVIADTSTWKLIRAIPSLIALIFLLRRLIRQRRNEPRDDLLSHLIAVQEKDDRLSSDEVLAMAFLLLVAGHETTLNLIGNGLLALIKYPDEAAKLRADGKLLASAVEELLRFAGPLQVATERYAAEAVEIEGIVIPKGSLVYVVLASANRDENAFGEPDRLDVSRQPNRHLAFGHGIHYCLGAPLARLETEVAIQRFLERFSDARLATDDRNLHWRAGLTIRGLTHLPVTLRR